MPERIANLMSFRACVIFERNAIRINQPELAVLARQRAREIFLETLERLDTFEDCVNMARNAAEKMYPEEAILARKRALEIRVNIEEILRGQKFGFERECFAAVFAYEEAMSNPGNRRYRATRTWQMIGRIGIVPAFERLVSNPVERPGYTSLCNLGLAEYAFEAVVLRHPNEFSPTAVQLSRERLGKPE